jgi:hypothetical protein
VFDQRAKFWGQGSCSALRMDAGATKELRVSILKDFEEYFELRTVVINEIGQPPGWSMSALPPKADICSAINDVRFGP